MCLFGGYIGAYSSLDGTLKTVRFAQTKGADVENRIKQADDPRLAPLNQLTFSVWLSRGAGLVLSVDVLLILLPMCRNLMRIIRPRFRWLPLDETQWFHRQVAYAMLLFT